MNRPDNCPECLTRSHASTVFPHRVVPDGSGGVVAFYACPCGYRWSCGWHLDAIGEAA